MDPEVCEKAPARQLRRSTRQSSVTKAMSFEPTPRGPLKRTKSKQESEVPASNGTVENDSDDEGSPNKKTCIKTGDHFASGEGNGPLKDVTEPMDTHSERLAGDGDGNVPLTHSRPPLNTPVPGSREDVKLKPLVVLGPRCSLTHPKYENVIKTQEEKPKNKASLPTKSVTQITSQTKISEPCNVTVTSMADYKRKMEARITENPKVNNYVPSKCPTSVTISRKRTVVLTPKTGVSEKKMDQKKTKVSPHYSGFPSKGFLTYLWQLVLFLLLSAGLLLAFKQLQTQQRAQNDSTHSSMSVNTELFVGEMSHVATRFPNQRPELWRRSQIHLQKHLDSPQPTEPVSLVLTAGLKAEKTLHCLAHSVASAFSSAVNSSVAVIDGASLNNLDSDQVKMDIDGQLKAAFGGDKLAAVVERFEELPPGSTLIFYRYCDHDTAAYKRAFLLFTVLLSAEDLSPQHSLKEVEELVRDHVEERLVGNDPAFNQMDADKFSGLWSRIAHLILPVAYEGEIEQRGC
ncbi:unnamed protein product [Knipowitschia caucasica]|uniref:Torsin-1A-interacting protein 1/2 AAA+ activator domain-containing protein n=1 Tax=Knipowitschia caucasica TaxID=637954 RepID=A0AAV2L0N3_KNICA